MLSVISGGGMLNVVCGRLSGVYGMQKEAGEVLQRAIDLAARTATNCGDSDQQRLTATCYNNMACYYRRLAATATGARRVPPPDRGMQTDRQTDRRVPEGCRQTHSQKGAHRHLDGSRHI